MADRQTKKKRQLLCEVCREEVIGGSCLSCADPKCSGCGRRLLSAEASTGRGMCAECDEAAAQAVERRVRARHLVAVTMTEDHQDRCHNSKSSGDLRLMPDKAHRPILEGWEEQDARDGSSPGVTHASPDHSGR